MLGAAVLCVGGRGGGDGAGGTREEGRNGVFTCHRGLLGMGVVAGRVLFFCVCFLCAQRRGGEAGGRGRGVRGRKSRNQGGERGFSPLALHAAERPPKRGARGCVGRGAPQSLGGSCGRAQGARGMGCGGVARARAKDARKQLEEERRGRSERTLLFPSPPPSREASRPADPSSAKPKARQGGRARAHGRSRSAGRGQGIGGAPLFGLGVGGGRERVRAWVSPPLLRLLSLLSKTRFEHSRFAFRRCRAVEGRSIRHA